ncbi:MAG TPA: phospholipase D-like domain-containing protein [Myxococcota bacterium]|nr:phospholipase D-like domain-containing protein [Myxococcota bacterium]
MLPLAPVLLALSACSSRQPFFSSETDLSEVLTSEVDAATSTVHVAIYTFTHEGIANAMENAALRGVEVQVVADRGQYDSADNAMAPTLNRLIAGGVEVRLAGGLSAGGILHHKFTVLDEGTVLTGSFNYTDFANTLHRENLLLLADPPLAAEFERVFSEIWDLAEAP